ncbi:MAG: histidine triad nucleotide-binding protein [Desulforhopalus sp.]
MSDCIFCKIIAGEIPADKLYEDDEVLAFRDIAPQAPVHLLVIPKKHIAAPSDITEPDEKLIGKLMRIGAQVAEEAGTGDAYRVIFNNGAKAGQVVFHIHMHILGGKDKPWPL